MPFSHLLNRWSLTVAVKKDDRGAPHVIPSEHGNEKEARAAYTAIVRKLKSGHEVVYANLTPPGNGEMIRLDLEKKK